MPKTVTGGKKLAAFIRANKAAARQQHDIGIGFRKGEPVTPLAILLEHGNPDTNLPERPAFRLGLLRISDELPGKLKAMVQANLRKRPPVLALSRAQAEELAIWARDVLRESYLNFRGPGLSERQAERKRGLEGAGKELIGHEGPKLVQHIKAYVDGVEVG